MKKTISLFLTLALCLSLFVTGAGAEILVQKVEDLPEGFLMGTDVSSLLSLEESGVVYYDFDGDSQDWRTPG